MLNFLYFPITIITIIINYFEVIIISVSNFVFPTFLNLKTIVYLNKIAFS